MHGYRTVAGGFCVLLEIGERNHELIITTNIH